MAHIQKRSYRSRRTGKVTTTWQARFTAPDGRARTKRFDHKVDAERWLDANGADITRGQWIDPDGGRETLRSFALRWLAQRHDLRPSTRAKYRHLLERHILPSLGDTQLSKLSPAQVRSWHSNLLQEHPST